MSTLLIKNVNLRLLEQQRKDLIDLETTLPDSKGLLALQGVIDMLDEWSDGRYNKDIKFVGSVAREYGIHLTEEEARQHYDEIMTNCDGNSEEFYKIVKEYFNN